MKKGTIILITLLLMVIGYSAYNTTINIYGNSKIAENISDFKVYISSLKVNGNEVSGINGAKDGFELSNVFGTIEYEITNDSTEYDTEASLECETNNTWDFDYTGSEQTLTIPITGTYKLETWGAEGGSANATHVGGAGGYSVGNIFLNSGETLYVNVGGAGTVDNDFNQKTYVTGGYNGGGNACGFKDKLTSAGGGATHIALSSGLLSSLSNSKNDILIVSGGGGGGGYQTDGFSGSGGSGGGYLGNSGSYVVNYQNLYTPNGATQSSGGSYIQYGEYTYYPSSFGLGGGAKTDNGNASGGGGGYFGGGLGNLFMGGGGGSGYIGNSLLIDKSMYCYNCSESSEVSTKTISTTCTSSAPTENCSKLGNGYARITLLKVENKITDKITITGMDSYVSKIENLNNITLTCKLKLNKISRTEKAIKKKHKITFDTNGGYSLSTIKELYYKEKYGELPVPSRDVYYFTGWYTSKTGGNKITSESILEINADQTLYAHWSGVTEISTPTNLTSYRGNNNKIYSFMVTGNNSTGKVWGSTIYTDDSTVSLAAIHAGLVKNGETKRVYVQILPGQSSYASSLSNSITSLSYGSYSGSFRFVIPITTPACTMTSYRGNNDALYSFSLKGSVNGCRGLWGVGTYTDDSALNSAAVHAGILKNNEQNTVYVEIKPGQSSYSASTSNGVTSIKYGSWPGSYKFLNLYN